MQPPGRGDRTAPGVHPRLQLPHTPRAGPHLLGLLRPEADPHADEDARIREALRNVSIEGLRSAGILELVLACANPSGPGAATDADAGAEELSDMDLDALLDLALDEKR